MTDTPRLARRSPKIKPGIVHLGPGAFFKAFSAIYTQEAVEQKGGDWGVIAVSLRSPTARDQLKPQEGVYTAVSLGPSESNSTVIGIISDVLVAPEDPSAVIDAMVDPAIRIVSLTITEKGYCYEPSTGQLKLDHPDIIHDIANREAPRSAPGYIVEALSRRRGLGHRPFTVLSCDNIPSNGKLAKKIVVSLAAKIDPNLARWIEDEVSFPSTMVDRITPATTEADIERVTNDEGYYDPACVFHEPFRQWVIEDEFVDGARPHWNVSGAQFVSSVEDHEAMKLRCLNGTHSSLAYLGYLAGFETISETVSDPDFANYLGQLWRDEIVPTVKPPQGEDLSSYCAALLERYQNPSIRHRTWQIAMDGSQKLPQRLLGVAQESIDAKRPISSIALAIAGWMHYVGGVDEDGQKIDVRDPLADALRAASDAGVSATQKAENLLSLDAVFDAKLANDDRFRVPVISAYCQLADVGAHSSIMDGFAK
ncbi:MAG: mannitol dehydrogenase family protein [Litoreibacter sp.]|uniref:mannitol dehydrogenase family protein n=1 Tax=Litoreibacter sp. TaxID=1969459 RepID=UPI003299D3BE